MTKIIKTSAPGNLMLMGEHAVLHGKRAIACAVDCSMFVELTPRKDEVVRIESVLANYEENLSDLPDCHALRFVVAAVKKFREKVPSGFKLTIAAGFSATVGLGSSAAVTVATIAALRKFCGLELEKRSIFADAYAVVRQVQGTGSGTDLAVSVYGGIIGYTMPSGSFEAKIANITGVKTKISLFYTGYKKPTPEVIALVNEHANAQPALYKSLYDLMGQTSEEAEEAIAENNWEKAGNLMNFYQGLMEALGVADKTIREIVSDLRQKGALGVKISGSGLGDCVLALGEFEAVSVKNAEKIPVEICEEGVTIEEV